MRNVTTVLLDEIKRAKGITSDYGLSKLLEVKPNAISNYRNGRSQMSDEVALKAARMMGRPLPPLLAALAADRAKNSEIAKARKEAAKILSRK